SRACRSDAASSSTSRFTNPSPSISPGLRPSSARARSLAATTRSPSNRSSGAGTVENQVGAAITYLSARARRPVGERTPIRCRRARSAGLVRQLDDLVAPPVADGVDQLDGAVDERDALGLAVGLPLLGIELAVGGEADP